MRKVFVLAVCALVFALILPVAAQQSVTVSYGSHAITPWTQWNAPQVWDLTRCDLTIQYTLNMGGQTNAGWTPIQVGMREVGAPNLDPNNLGGWLQSNYRSASNNPNTIDLNDHHILTPHGWASDERHYNVLPDGSVVAAFGTFNNFGFHFDRDGVDQWQAQQWDMQRGAYNTGGVYQMQVTYRAVGSNLGTMFAIINGYGQGIYTAGWKNQQPDIYPAGRAFAGDMSRMQLFIGSGNVQGSVNLSNLTVSGCLANRPPVCGAAYPSLDSLWPVNQRMVPVNVWGVTDPDGDPISITISGIYQDEPVKGPGSGNTAPDGSGVGTDTAWLRAERSGTANGRVYTVYFTAADGSGGSCDGQVKVSVPHNLGRKGQAVDDGPLYDSTLP